MTKTVLFSSILAIAIATTLVGSAFASDSWLGIFPGTSSVDQTKPKITTFTLNATDIVDRSTFSLAGFAWFDSPTTGLAITTHNAKEFAGTHQNPARDSTQNPDGWHAHNVSLKAGTGSSTFCVDDLSSAPNVGLKINGSWITVNARTADVGTGFDGSSAAFHIQPDLGCAPTIGSSIPLGVVVAP